MDDYLPALFCSEVALDFGQMDGRYAHSIQRLEGSRAPHALTSKEAASFLYILTETRPALL